MCAKQKCVPSPIAPVYKPEPEPEPDCGSTANLTICLLLGFLIALL